MKYNPVLSKAQNGLYPFYPDRYNVTHYYEP